MNIFGVVGCPRITYYQVGEGLKKSTVHFLERPEEKSASLKKCNNYYPFGLTFNSYSSGTKNNYLYNQGFGKTTFQGQEGKTFAVERQPELGVDFTKYRVYDPALGRFWNVDPAAEMFGQDSWTPYHYSFNNPIRWNDPFGNYPPRGPGAGLFKQAVSDFLTGLGFTESPPSKSSSNSNKKDQRGGTIVTKEGGGADPTQTTAEYIDGETPIDGMDQLGKSRKSGSASENVANALGSIFSAVSEFFSGEGGDTKPDTENTPNKETSTKSDSKKNERTFVGRKVQNLAPSGRIEIDSTFKEGDSTYTETTLYKDALGNHPNKRIDNER